MSAGRRSGGGVLRTGLLRALVYRRVQTGVVVLVSALLAGAATFAPWYDRLVEDTAVRDAFTAGADGSTLSLTAPDAAELAAHLPQEVAPFFDAPVTGRTASMLWASPHRDKLVEGGLVSREGVCEQVRLVRGTCPGRSGEIAVSTADAELYLLEPGTRVVETSPRYDAATFTVTGVYELDADDPYWFSTLPTGRSGYRDLDIPVSDQFVTAPETFTATPGRDFTSRLDVRVTPDAVGSDDLPALASAVDHLDSPESDADFDLLTTMDDTLSGLEESRSVARSTLLLTVGQVAVLGLAVLNMLVGLVLLTSRPEVGLARLRGQPVRRVAGEVTTQWFVVVLLGALAGTGLGLTGALLARAALLSGGPPVALPVWVPAALAGTVLVALGLMLVRARRLAGEPVPALLRAVPPRTNSAATGAVLDAALVTAALAALVTGLQSSGSGVLVLLAPSLLAVAAGVLLARLVGFAGAAAARRWLVRGRTVPTLAAISLSRQRGLASLLVVLVVATSFSVFATQVDAVADRSREHRARVETGAPLVVRTNADPAHLVAALDAIDPARDLATAVVQTQLGQRDEMSVMFVETGAFRRIAYGAHSAADLGDWQAISPPEVPPLELTGDRVSLVADATGLTGDDGAAPELRVELDYLGDDGAVSTAVLGRPAGRAARLSARIDCADGCRLVRWRFVPDGDVSGTLSVTDLGISGSAASPLDLGSPGDWQAILGAPDYELDLRPGSGTMQVRLSTGGRELVAQHAWVPAEARMLLAEEHPTSATRDGVTVQTPAGDLLPGRVVAVAHDAVPRLLRDVALVDIATSVRRGDRLMTPDTEAQLWYSADGAAQRERLADDLAEAGIRTEPIGDADQRVRAFARTPEALTGAVNPAAAAVALLLAVLGLVLATAAGWRARTHDLAALRLVGLPRRALLTATCATQLALVVLAVVAGTACGLVGYALAADHLSLSADPEPAIASRLGIEAGLAGGVVLGMAVVLAGAALASATWLVRRSGPQRAAEYDG